MNRSRSDPAATRLRLREALGTVTERLSRAGVVSASVDARALIEHAARSTGPLVLLDVLPADFDARLEAATARRAAREPLQLILGRAPFRRLSLEVRPGVFIPRPETEVAIDLLLEHARSERVRTVVDLCTGSGALAAAVADELPAADVVALEVDPAAADLAARNVAAAGHPGAPGRVEVRRGDVTDPAVLADLRGVDAVVSNPPYIPPGARPRDAEVWAHDPERALYGGGVDGLDAPRAVLDRAAEMLRPGGLLVMEHADSQGRGAREAAESTGHFVGIRAAPDLTGRDRFLVAYRRPGGQHAEAGAGSEKLTR